MDNVNPTAARIASMLQACGTDDAVLPATTLYNEGWMLRAILDWFSRHPGSPHPLSFRPGARWFSEALLPSQFLPRTRTDALAESWTHADGVVGLIEIGAAGRADVALRADATQFIVLEAKLFSKLSAGVKNAPYFDQAARNLACIAEVLSRSKRPPADFSSLGFFVLAPLEQISLGVFAPEVAKESIRDKVTRRVRDFQSDDSTRWFEEWFLPTLAHAQVGCLTWEEILAHISSEDPTGGEELGAFYAACLRFNRPPEEAMGS